MPRQLATYLLPLALLALAGCETSLQNFGNLDLPAHARRVAVLDRHGLYVAEPTSPHTDPAVILQPPLVPATSLTLPTWIQDFDDTVDILLDAGIRETVATEGSYELVFPAAPLPAVYMDPFDPTQDPWPEPMDAQEVVDRAQAHAVDAIVTLDFVQLNIFDNGFVQSIPTNAPYPHASPFPAGTVMVHVRCGFRSYDGTTGEPLDKIAVQHAGSRNMDTHNAPAPLSTIDLVKNELASESLEECSKLMDKALFPAGTKIQ